MHHFPLPPLSNAHSQTGLLRKGWQNLQAGLVPTLSQQATPKGPAGSSRGGEGVSLVPGKMTGQSQKALSIAESWRPNSPSLLAWFPLGIKLPT